MKKQSVQSGCGMEEDNKNCKEKFCKQKIFSDKDWRNEALRIKKEAREKGITNFEFTPEYEEITKCRSQLDGVFPLQSECKCENCPKQIQINAKDVLKDIKRIKKLECVNQKILHLNQKHLLKNKIQPHAKDVLTDIKKIKKLECVKQKSKD